MKSWMLLAAAATACSVGCTNARYVTKGPDAGVVAIPSNTDVWPTHDRTAALKLIVDHVGPGYEVYEEKEFVTGSVTTNTQDTKREATFNPNLPFLPAEKEETTTTTRSTPTKEYHLHYRRKPAVAAAPVSGQVPAGPQPGGGVVPVQYTVPAPAVGVQTPGSVSPAALNVAGGIPVPSVLPGGN